MVLPGDLVEVRTKEREFPAYLARPDAAEAPGVVVIHELFGLTAWIREVVDRFAQRGFIAIAPDLFTGRVHPRFSPEVALKVMPVVWELPVEQRANEKALRAALKGHSKEDVETAVGLSRIHWSLEWVAPTVADLKGAAQHVRELRGCTGKVGSVGFCFGGRMSFELAAADPALSAAVVFYGIGPREEAIERIGCPVLGLYGSLDENVTKDVPRAARMMERHGKVFEHEVFDRTGHAFARPGSKGYHEGNAARAWERTDAFLARHLDAASLSS
jgi:carboxymethylenebutenolidase